jgi:hypothetical protein
LNDFKDFKEIQDCNFFNIQLVKQYLRGVKQSVYKQRGEKSAKNAQLERVTGDLVVWWFWDGAYNLIESA